MSMTLDPIDTIGAAPPFDAPPNHVPTSAITLDEGNGEPAAVYPAPNDDSSANNPARDPVSAGPQKDQSALTEFTKRRNWAAKVIEELKDLLHILDANGRIKHVSPSAENLTGYKPAELRDLLMQDLLHPDDVGVFTSELNASIASGASFRVFYRMKRKDGAYAVFESVGHAHIAAAKFAPNPNNQTPFCQAVFMMARPYPTKNAALLDSFLEHKMENERLRRKIAELRKEEQEEAEESEKSWQQSQETTPSEKGLRFGGAGFQPDSPAAVRDARASADSGRTESNASTRRASIGNTHADTIEMLTGLRYQEGERSHGLTTGNPSPALITGDAGIAIPVDRDHRTGDKKKKLKLAEEYVCTDCGTLESPEWRKGPGGPKTLCNACGLRWAKREKKKSAVTGASDHAPAVADAVS
ncbi:hypothetical protein B0J18DRAFT_405712 [Chaetomium sp. MPI-SDFR-AT-0129]|nr:hypothetical protein B0J18DRAFT_405712 [Chaetomium sp. MPI-SDFR-AT-0129]